MSRVETALSEWFSNSLRHENKKGSGQQSIAREKAMPKLHQVTGLCSYNQDHRFIQDVYFEQCLQQL